MLADENPKIGGLYGQLVDCLGQLHDETSKQLARNGLSKLDSSAIKLMLRRSHEAINEMERDIIQLGDPDLVERMLRNLISVVGLVSILSSFIRKNFIDASKDKSVMQKARANKPDKQGNRRDILRPMVNKVAVDYASLPRNERVRKIGKLLRVRHQDLRKLDPRTLNSDIDAILP